MRLIDADARCEKIEDNLVSLSTCITVDWYRGKSQMKKYVLEAIKNAPTIKVKPKTVEEEVEEVAFVDDWGDYLCTGCDAAIKSEIRYMVDKPIEYCPCCGRKVKVISIALD